MKTIVMTTNPVWVVAFESKWGDWCEVFHDRETMQKRVFEEATEAFGEPIPPDVKTLDDLTSLWFDGELHFRLSWRIDLVEVQGKWKVTS